ncbi:hypothetical protein ACNKHM_09905 [Shigella sonnei]
MLLLSLERAVCLALSTATDPLFPLTLAVLSLMLATLLLFVVLWSNPFVRIFPPAIEGRDLNPMLQHPG